MAQSSNKHIHKLKRFTYKNGSQIFICVLPDCYFKISTELSLGKHCICWRCGNVFQLNQYSLRLAKPHCENCHQSKQNQAKDYLNARKGTFNEIMQQTAKDDVKSLSEQMDKIDELDNEDIL